VTRVQFLAHNSA